MSDIVTSFLLSSLAPRCGTPWGVQYTKVGSCVYFLLLLQQEANTPVPWNTTYYHIAQEEKNVANLPHFNSTWVKLTSHSSLCGHESTFRLLGSGMDSSPCGYWTDRAISHLHIVWSSCSPFKAYLRWSSRYFQFMHKWNCTSCMAFNFLYFLFCSSDFSQEVSSFQMFFVLMNLPTVWSGALNWAWWNTFIHPRDQEAETEGLWVSG